MTSRSDIEVGSRLDPCAELTLRIVRMSQEALNPLSSLADWCFLPENRHARWADAREILSRSPKPTLIAPLVEPGMIVVWSLDSVQADVRQNWEREFANQCEYFDEKLKAFGLGDADGVTLTGPTGEYRITVADFGRWARDYAIPVAAIGLKKSSAAHEARILIRPPGGGRPLGLESRA
jgi:hypothetical protein